VYQVMSGSVGTIAIFYRLRLIKARVPRDNNTRLNGSGTEATQKPILLDEFASLCTFHFAAILYLPGNSANHPLVSSSRNLFSYSMYNSNYPVVLPLTT